MFGGLNRSIIIVFFAQGRWAQSGMNQGYI